MNLQRCKKGHFYDADRDPVCPHCISGDRLDDERTQQALPIRPQGFAQSVREAPARPQTFGLHKEER